MIHEEEKKEPLPGAGDEQPPSPLNTPSTDRPITPAEPNPEAEQPQTTNYKPATEEMEVDHHTHPALRSYDVSIQQDLAYCINQIKGSNIILTTRLKWLLEKATHTIEFLQKEYHLN